MVFIKNKEGDNDGNGDEAVQDENFLFQFHINIHCKSIVSF